LNPTHQAALAVVQGREGGATGTPAGQAVEPMHDNNVEQDQRRQFQAVWSVVPT